MKRVFALAALLTLAGCDNRGGWYPAMECKQRDLKTGMCVEATYSCKIDNQMLAYYADGPRCYGRGPVR